MLSFCANQTPTASPLFNTFGVIIGVQFLAQGFNWWSWKGDKSVNSVTMQRRVASNVSESVLACMLVDWPGRGSFVTMEVGYLASCETKTMSTIVTYM